MTRGHLSGKLLDLDLLELAELGAARLHQQLAVAVVLNTDWALTFFDGHEGTPGDLLIRLEPALLARVGHDLGLRLHVRATCDHRADGYELPDVVGAHVSQRHVVALILVHQGQPNFESALELVGDLRVGRLPGVANDRSASRRPRQ